MLVSGLVTPDIVARGQALIASNISERAETAFRSRDFAFCFSEELCQVAASLGNSLGSSEQEKPYYPISTVLVIITPQSEEWSALTASIDHALPQQGHLVFPPPYRLASLLFLTDTLPHGGSTVVWPGSHKVLGNLAQSNPERFATMASLNQHISQLDLGEPLEVVAKAGDILFYHYLLAYSISTNIAETPRITISYKW